MLAFAKYASSQNYWAKDVIFLVTEHEQLGMQAWLQAYHSKGFDGEGFLNYGDLRGRGGQIQGAINLEMNDLKIGNRLSPPIVLVVNVVFFRRDGCENRRDQRSPPELGFGHVDDPDVHEGGVASDVQEPREFAFVGR